MADHDECVDELASFALRIAREHLGRASMGIGEGEAPLEVQFQVAEEILKKGASQELLDKIEECKRLWKCIITTEELIKRLRERMRELQ